MSALLSSTKAAAILARVQLNPTILTNDATYVADVIQRAAETFVRKANIPRYPELSQGYSESAASPSTDITAIDSNRFKISINGSGFQEITITLAGLNSGAAIATELQAQIRAVTADTSHGFDEVTVVYGTVYTITSGRYGEASNIVIDFDETYKHVAQNLKLSTSYGGTEPSGMAAAEEVDDAIVMMVEHLYRKMDLEGLKSGSVPGDGDFEEYEFDPHVMAIVRGNRRLW